MPNAAEQALGQGECEVEREMCPDLLRSLRHAHFYQITPALAEVSKLQAVSPLRVNTHTRTRTHPSHTRQKPGALEPRQEP